MKAADPPAYDDSLERPLVSGSAGHVLAVLSGLLLLGFRWVSFDVLGTDGSVAWSILLVVLMGRVVGGAASWTVLVVGVVPIVWLRWVADQPNASWLSADIVIRTITYLGIGGYATLQRERWRLRMRALRIDERTAVEANSRWQMASEFAEIGTFDWDIQADTSIWSPVMQRLHGFAAGEHDGKAGTGFSRVHPDDVAVIQQAVTAAAASGETTSLVYRVCLPDGSERWIEGIGRVQSADGKPTRVVGVCIDVTERHEAKLASVRFEALTTHAPVGIYQSDVAGRCVYVNPAWTRILGHTLKDLNDDKWARWIHPEDRERIVALWTDINKNPRPFETELRYLHVDGRTISGIAHNAPLVDEHGRHLGFVGSVTDITERKQVEESLQSSEARFRALIDNAEPAVFLKDEAGRYQIVNATFERLTKLSAEQIIGRTDDELFPPDVATSFRATDRRVWETKQAEQVEESLPLADGIRYYLSIKYPITDGRGRVVALGGFATDITARKEMEDKLRRDRQLLRDLIDVQEQERQYICNELHDGTIQYLVGALMHLQSPTVQAGDRAGLERVETFLIRAASEARRLIAGVRSSLLDDMGVVAAIEDLVAQSRDVGVEVKVYRDDEFRDLDDKIAVTVFRVVQEALSNVRKHGGVNRAEVELRRGEKEIIFVVRDEGRGFKPGSEPAECFGLRGMRERVLLAGGKFSLVSAPEKGTTVRAELPLTPQPSSASR
ncbi:MAG: hypothetical protein C0483_01445 [Pirellula sp.]|nr:hypothetical protein [Pirellula sp.]